MVVKQKGKTAARSLQKYNKFDIRKLLWEKIERPEHSHGIQLFPQKGLDWIAFNCV